MMARYWEHRQLHSGMFAALAAEVKRYNDTIAVDDADVTDLFAGLGLDPELASHFLANVGRAKVKADDAWPGRQHYVRDTTICNGNDELSVWIEFVGESPNLRQLTSGRLRALVTAKAELKSGWQHLFGDALSVESQFDGTATSWQICALLPPNMMGQVLADNRVSS